MRGLLSALGHVLPVYGLVHGPNALAKRQADNCPIHETVESQFLTTVVGQPVVLSTVVQSSTVIPAGGPFGGLITITAGPSTLLTTSIAFTTLIYTKLQTFTDTYVPGDPTTSFTFGPVPGTTTVPGSGTNLPVVIVTTVPPDPVTSFTSGPVPGTTTIPADGTNPPVVVVTQVPETSFTTGPVPGTSTIPGDGTSPPVFIVTQVPSFTTGPVPGTTTVPGSGTNPPVVIVTQVPETSFTSGPIPGTSITPGSGTNPPVVIVTQVPGTSFTTGPVPGTSTIPADGTSPPVVIVTLVPSFTTGPVPGTSIIPADGTTPPVVIITQVPSTSFTTGPVEGTAIVPADGTTPPVVIITQVPVTSFTPGPVGGTTTLPPVGTNPPVVIVTTVLSTITTTVGSVSFTSTVPTTNANGTPATVVVVGESSIASRACPPAAVPTGASCAPGLNVDAYANDIVSANAYGVPASGVGPDYYIGLTPYARGQISSLSVPRINNPGGSSVSIPGVPQYHPEVTAQYAGFTYNPNNSTMVFTGYFRPPTSGTYTICTSADNLNNFYDGSEQTFDCDSTDTPRGATPTVTGLFTGAVCVSVVYEANQFYPIRSVYGMNGLPSFLTTTITAPGGTAPLDLQGLLFPQSCVAPPGT